MHLADLMENRGEIVACDIYPHKLRLVEESAKKLGVEIVKTVLADATVYRFEKKFDHVLVDAPCSGLGVMAHKVDLKYQMTLEKITELTELQKRYWKMRRVCKKRRNYLQHLHDQQKRKRRTNQTIFKQPSRIRKSL